MQLGCPAMNNLDLKFFVQNLLPPPSTKNKYIKTSRIERDLSSVLVEINHDIVLLLLCRVNSEQFSARSWNPSVRLLKGALKIGFSTCKWATEMTRNSCCLFNTCLPYWLHNLWPESQQNSPKNHPFEKSNYMHYLHFLPTLLWTQWCQNTLNKYYIHNNSIKRRIPLCLILS